MILAPILPALVVAVLGVALAAAALWRHRHQPVLLVLRLATVVILTVMLANPLEVWEESNAVRPQAVLVLDHSLSMAQADGDADGATRLAVAQTAVTSLYDSLRTSWLVDRASFADALVPGLASTASGDTDFDALADLAQRTPPPTVAILLSDGADWKGRRPEVALREAGVVVHTLGTGRPGHSANLAVHLETASPTAFPGQDLPLAIGLTATASLVGRPVEVVLEHLDQQTGAATPVLSQTVTLASSQRLPVAVPVGEVLGSRLWRVRVSVLPGEVSRSDNTAHASAQVVDRTLRVLVCEGQPWWDTTFAVRAWRRDRQIQVDSRFALGSKRYRTGEEQPAAAPADPLAETDLVVLGRQGLSLLEVSRDRLTAWVDAGGNLLVLGPDRAALEALGSLAPLTLGDGSVSRAPQVTSTGRRLGLLAGHDPTQLAALNAAPVRSTAAQTQILLGDAELPLVVQRRTGSGLVTVVNAEGLWRWQLGDTDAEHVSARFWRQLVKSNARTVAGTLRPGRVRHRLGEEAEVFLASDEVAQATITAPDGRTLVVAASGGAVRFPLDQSGLWRIAAGGEEAILVVDEDQGERLFTAREDARLGALADATGGTHRDVTAWKELATLLHERAALAEDRRQRSRPLITDPAWFIALALLLGLEWLLRRRRYGLV